MMMEEQYLQHSASIALLYYTVTVGLLFWMVLFVAIDRTIIILHATKLRGV